MRARPFAAARRSAVPETTLAVVIAVFAIQEGQFVVLVQRSGGSGPDRVELPWRKVSPEASLDDEARQALEGILRVTPPWIEQVRTDVDGGQPPSGTTVTVVYAATLSYRLLPRDGSFSWLPVSAPKGLSQRQGQLAAVALRFLRERMDIVPIAFRLLPAAFTLGDLQGTYELLLDRRLHKASFRRALQAARLVEPTDQWRREGRGRPAQLFRYAPRRKKRVRRTVRFDLLD